MYLLAQASNVTEIVNPWQMIIIILPSILAFLTSCFSLYIAYLSHIQGALNSNKIDEAAVKQVDLHNQMNSRLDELIVSIKKSSYQEGLAEGSKRERERESNNITT